MSMGPSLHTYFTPLNSLIEINLIRMDFHVCSGSTVVFLMRRNFFCLGKNMILLHSVMQILTTFPYFPL